MRKPTGSNRHQLKDAVQAASKSPGVLLICLITFVAFVLPVIMVVLGAFLDAAPGSRGGWTLKPLTAVLGSSATYVALRNSIVLALGSVLFGVGSAVVLCWLAVRSDTRLRSVATPSMILLFAVPQLFYAMSWGLLGQHPTGSLNRLVQVLSGSQAAPVDMVSWAGLVLIMGLKIASISYLLLLGPFGAVDSSLEEAGRLSGSTKIGAFFRIELPVLAPALLSAVVLGMVIAVGSLDIPLVIGGPARIPVLSTEIYAYINTRVPADYASANSIALFVIAVIAILVTGQRSLLGRRQFTTISGKSHRRERVSLGKWRWVGGLAIAAFVTVGLVLPLGQLVLGSLQPYAGVFNRLTLDNYSLVLSDSRTLNAFVATLWIGLLAGFLATASAALISVVAHRSSSPLHRAPQAMAILLLAVPGITIGLGVLAVVLTVPGVQSIYGTQWLNVIGLGITMTPIANRITSAAVVQVGPEMEESARMSGASALRAVLGILLRLILPSFLASWLITGVVAAGNLEIPALLSSPGSETITIVALQYFQLGSYAQASAVFCLMLGFIALSIALAQTTRVAVAFVRNRRNRIPQAQSAKTPSGGPRTLPNPSPGPAATSQDNSAFNERNEEKVHG